MYLTENLSSRNEMWCAIYKNNLMCHFGAKKILDLNFNEAVVDNQFFTQSPQTFTYLQTSSF